LHRAYRDEGYLPKERIRELFKKHMEATGGSAVLKTDVGDDTWVLWPHFRMFFYVYSYANGSLISKALQRKLKVEPETISKIKEFLSAGSSDSPENIFKNLGIYIKNKNFWLEGLAEIDEQ